MFYFFNQTKLVITDKLNCIKLKRTFASWALTQLVKVFFWICSCSTVEGEKDINTLSHDATLCRTICFKSLFLQWLFSNLWCYILTHSQCLTFIFCFDSFIFTILIPPCKALWAACLYLRWISINIPYWIVDKQQLQCRLAYKSKLLPLCMPFNSLYLK